MSPGLTAHLTVRARPGTPVQEVSVRVPGADVAQVARLDRTEAGFAGQLALPGPARMLRVQLDCALPELTVPCGDALHAVDDLHEVHLAWKLHVVDGLPVASPEDPGAVLPLSWQFLWLLALLAVVGTWSLAREGRR